MGQTQNRNKRVFWAVLDQTTGKEHKQEFTGTFQRETRTLLLPQTITCMERQRGHKSAFRPNDCHLKQTYNIILTVIKPKAKVDGSNEHNVLALLVQMVPICKFYLQINFTIL